MPGFYTVQVGSREWSRWYASDDHALRSAHRWIRRFWQGYVAGLPPSCMARAICEGWYGCPPVAVVYRRPHNPQTHVIRCVPAIKIAEFPVAFSV
jgi:hypothetical protein